MALKYDIELAPQPIEQSSAASFLFSAELVQAMHPDDESCQFLNFTSEHLQFSLPLIVKSGVPGKRIVMTQFTPFFKLDFSSLESLPQTRQISIQRHAVQAITEELTRLNPVLVELNFWPFYWLPFQWAGFDVTPRVTYRLQTGNGEQKLFDGLRSNIQRQIKKSAGAHQLSEADNIETLFRMNKASYERKNEEHPFDGFKLQRLYTYLKEQKKGRILEIKDSDGDVLASALFGWDAECVYYLTGGFREDASASGAMSRVIWEGIILAQSLGRTFDFEGSMNEGIEYFFSSFGGTPTTYFQVRKSNSKLYELYQKIRS